jgi:hypothetical protein
MSAFLSNKFSATMFFCMVLNGTLFAQYYGYFQMSEEPTTPRIAAMGSAGTALSGGGFGCYNPASPAFAEAPFLSIEYGSQPGDLSKSKIETAWMFSRWFVGASLLVHTNDFNVTTERTDETTMNAASSSDQSMLATVTGGYVWGRFAAGSSINFLQERIGDQAWHAFTYCPGIQFQLVPNSITIGASMLHYLRIDTTGSPWYKTPAVWYRSARGFPRYARAGIAWRDTVRRWALPFTAACDFVYSDVYERFMVPLGVEAWILPSIAARAGVNINHPSEIVHFGVGIRWSSVEVGSLEFDFDYGLSQPVSSADLETKWMFGLTYSIYKKKKQTAAPSAVPRKPMPLQIETDDSTAAARPKPPEPVIIVPVLPSVADSAKSHASKPDTASKKLPEPAPVVPDSLTKGSIKAAPIRPDSSSNAVFPEDSLSF